MTTESVKPTESAEALLQAIFEEPAVRPVKINWKTGLPRTVVSTKTLEREMTPVEAFDQWDELDARLGKGIGASKERQKLAARMNMGLTTRKHKVTGQQVHVLFEKKS